jgi:hypothetical protein
MTGSPLSDLKWPSAFGSPFGGITRIRFKGFVQDVSAVAAPPRYAAGYCGE